jgi:hypothetical protein
MTYAVSPQFTAAKLSSGLLDDEIDVYEDQVTGWLFQPAQLLLAEPHAGFALLSLVLTYFEPMGQFLSGQVGRSQDQFTKGLKAVFPSLSPSPPASVFAELYDQLRCGMFHRGITKGKVRVARGTATPIVAVYATSGDVQSITVDPGLLLSEIQMHHVNYVSTLRSPNEVQLRENFHAWFNARAA